MKGSQQGVRERVEARDREWVKWAGSSLPAGLAAPGPALANPASSVRGQSISVPFSHWGSTQATSSCLSTCFTRKTKVLENFDDYVLQLDHMPCLCISTLHKIPVLDWYPHAIKMSWWSSRKVTLIFTCFWVRLGQMFYSGLFSVKPSPWNCT